MKKDKSQKVETKELGLAATLILGRFFFQTEDLHYGYWSADLPVEVGNIKKAQEAHSRLVLDHIPERTRSILDVGCGAGLLARRLIENQFSVTGVCPSQILYEQAKTLLEPLCSIHLSSFENLQTTQKYDLILFSESFQYIKLPMALKQACRFLNPGGHILICDFLKPMLRERVLWGGDIA